MSNFQAELAALASRIAENAEKYRRGRPKPHDRQGDIPKIAFHDEPRRPYAFDHPTLRPLPHDLSDRIPQEIFELFIDFLHNDKPSLSNCSIVCRAWLPASRYHLSLVVRPVRLNFGWGLDRVRCAVTLREPRAAALCRCCLLTPL